MGLVKGWIRIGKCVINQYSVCCNILLSYSNIATLIIFQPLLEEAELLSEIRGAEKK